MNLLAWRLEAYDLAGTSAIGTVTIGVMNRYVVFRRTEFGSWVLTVYLNEKAAHAEAMRLTDVFQQKMPDLVGPVTLDVAESEWKDVLNMGCLDDDLTTRIQRALDYTVDDEFRG